VLIATLELAQVKNLFRAMGREDLIAGPLCVEQKERLKYRAQYDSLIEEWTKTRTTQEILAALKKVDVPCTHVPTYDQVCNDPQLLSREMIIEVEQPLSGKVKVPGSLFKLSRTPGNVNMPAPRLGEHNPEIFAQLLGYSPQEIDHLTQEGTI
jgi:crotonobetainyl-CoA:carnitine CoA-transferase CaiB-like acyl-CoA transferase